MKLLSKAYSWVLAAFSFVGLVFYLIRKGEKKGRKEVELEILQEVNKKYEDAKESDDRVNTIPKSDVRNRMQHYTKDD